MAEWIWLDPEGYPELQKTAACRFDRKDRGYRYGMAEFRRKYSFGKAAQRIRIRVFGDTAFRLWVNGAFAGQGPVAAGGDFLCKRPMPKQYYNQYEITDIGEEADFFAQVQLSPVALTDYSCGHGGFWIDAEVLCQDGTRISLGTDTSWEARVNGAYVRPFLYDGRIEPGRWQAAVLTEEIWNLQKPPIPMLWEETVEPAEGSIRETAPLATEEYTIYFDRIYSGYLWMDIQGACDITVECFEREAGGGDKEQIITDGDLQYRSMQMHSIGGYKITVTNPGETPVRIRPALVFTCYPIGQSGSFETSDAMLNKVYEVCKWTLQICRQTLHLDSPKHQEPLACTGDYYIESLMTAFTFGDMRLAAFDVLRTADWLKENKGVMFHTSYSLIWVQMLYDVYLYTGDTKLLCGTKEALDILLERFASYLGDNGVLEHAPNYMFVDWTVIEGYSMHHPPKALGQTCLNAFYYNALRTAVKICREMGDETGERRYEERGRCLKTAFGRAFYDKEKELYFDGLPTPGEVNADQPENIAVRHFSAYGNTLAVLYDLCEADQRPRLMKWVLEREGFPDVQPYFMHFVLEAVHHAGLFGTYGMKLLSLWKDVAAECEKGLKEGWFAPEEGYGFDYSHAWGGTPAYQLPCRMLGFEMKKPGFREISLKPNLYGLDHAKIVMPTPYGDIRCIMEQGKEPVVEVPEGIGYTVLLS
nr:hypothetical protein [uncultured Acetatifactor sp.]